MTTKGFCPNCETETQLERKERLESFQVKGESINVSVTIFVCKECGTDFYDPDSDPNDTAFREYRKQHQWTQPEEIVAFRKQYGFSQAELADLLGWGIATLSRYENGALQSESHERVLGLLKEPLNILRLLKENRGSFPPERRQDLISSLTPRRNELISKLFETILAKDDVDEYSGYRKFDLNRLKTVIQFFCKGGCQKTNLNKLLFYTDFKACKEFGLSITGTRYVRIDYGPVIDDFNFYFASMVEEGLLEVEEVLYPNGYVGEKYIAKTEPDLSNLNDSERDVLLSVKRQLGGLTAKEIADRSHKEAAYKKSEEKKPISYIHSKELSL